MSEALLRRLNRSTHFVGRIRFDLEYVVAIETFSPKVRQDGGEKVGWTHRPSPTFELPYMDQFMLVGALNVVPSSTDDGVPKRHGDEVILGKYVLDDPPQTASPKTEDSIVVAHVAAGD